MRWGGTAVSMSAARLADESGISRRTLVAWGGAGAVALASQAAATRGPGEQVMKSGRADGLTRRRRETYQALLDVVAAVPGVNSSQRARSVGVRALRRHLAFADPRERLRVLAALDALGRSTPPTFASAPVERRVRALVDRVAERHDPAIADALGLGVAPFHPASFRAGPSAYDLWLRAARRMLRQGTLSSGAR
jgi:hypothetical protein